MLTLHAPLVESTRHLVDERLLFRVKPGAILINCGCGGLLDPDATLAVLESGRLSGVGLDCSTPSRPSTTRCSTTLTSSSPRT
ncbi:NAD(P)-dependent oxidoreductase [Streptomyces mirabilis]|uniref:NAD(P)-dependent oxidoreductase n=1 Tax=Streptomyces mirabilis TaxID=68239 RepID=UPI0036DB5D06